MNGHSGWYSPPPPLGALSNKSSSLPSSFQLDEGGILSDLGHFEEIGLDDDTKPTPRAGGGSGGVTKPIQRNNNSGLASLRDLTVKRPPQPSHPHAGPSTDHLGLPGSSRRLASPSSPGGRRPRNTSPSPSSSCPHSPALSASSSPSSSSNGARRSYTIPLGRRNSWAKRKTAEELEKECDSDGDDEIPADAVLQNVPISPLLSRNISPASSPERPNGKASPPGASTSRSPTRQVNGRGEERARGRLVKSKSWNDAIVEELSPEARELTEKLEEFAEEERAREEKRRQNMVNGDQVKPKRISLKRASTIDLPPLQVSNGMIDPLPISKEKEAVLSRTRPSWLPPKSKEEEKRHLREYQKMMQSALEAERRKAEKEKREMEQKEKMKAEIHRIWEQVVIPDWDTMVQKPETRELWWRGVAPRCRAVVWSRALGNQLAATEETFRLALERAKELEKGKGSIQTTKEQEMFAAIRRDVGDTFPDLKIFQEHGPLHESLIEVLFAYTMYRSDVGYVYGTHVIAAILLLNQSQVQAFVSLVNILNRPVPLAFYTHDEAAISKVYTLFLKAFRYKLPKLFEHIHIVLGLQPRTYLESMFLTLFSLHCPLDVTSRLWDVYVFEGDAFLVRTAIGVLTALEPQLYGSREEVVGLLGWRAKVWTLVGGEEGFLETVRAAGKEEREVDDA